LFTIPFPDLCGPSPALAAAAAAAAALSGVGGTFESENAKGVLENVGGVGVSRREEVGVSTNKVGELNGGYPGVLSPDGGVNTVGLRSIDGVANMPGDANECRFEFPFWAVLLFVGRPLGLACCGVVRPVIGDKNKLLLNPGDVKCEDLAVGDANKNGGEVSKPWLVVMLKGCLLEFGVEVVVVVLVAEFGADVVSMAVVLVDMRGDNNEKGRELFGCEIFPYRLEIKQSAVLLSDPRASNALDILERPSVVRLSFLWLLLLLGMMLLMMCMQSYSVAIALRLILIEFDWFWEKRDGFK
jgi:hypothetical protein